MREDRLADSFATRRRRPSVPLIVLIVLLHLAAIYGLVRAFAPDFVASAERSVLSTVTVTVTAPEPPPPPPLPPEPQEASAAEGAQGNPGDQATPREVVAPEPEIVIPRENPAPRASSTGTENRSGAAESGSGTGAAGSGTGTGAGGSGSGTGAGRGGVAVTKPVHVSGGIDAASDYPVPPGGREARLGTSVIIRLVVGTDGRAKSCSIYRPSPDAEADRITCRLAQQRLRFRPAQDANGDPVEAPFYWQQRWFAR